MNILHRAGKSFLLILFILPWVLLIFLLVFSLHKVLEENQEVSVEEWGSFTPYKTYSYDNKFYAVQTVDKRGKNKLTSVVVVSVYDAETNELVGDFRPARSWDFWGICWESDSYNIWTQSSDIGTYCYVYRDGRWVRDEKAVRPEDIVTRYDIKHK